MKIVSPSCLRGRHRALLLSIALALVASSSAGAATDLLAFASGTARRQGSFTAGGVLWTCQAELCRAQTNDSLAAWPEICAALAREAGPLVAFGSLGQRFDPEALARCNQGDEPRPAAAGTPSPPAAAAAAPAASPAPSVTPSPPAAPSPAPAAVAPPNLEICNGHDDDADGAIDEGVRMTVWEDRDRDLYGDPARSRALCPHELSPGAVLNDYDCDDTDPRRNPARENCPRGSK